MAKWGWTAHRALLKTCESVLDDVSPEERDQLFRQLRALGRTNVELLMRDIRDAAEYHLGLTKIQRRKWLASLEAQEALLLRYAAAAWSAKAVTFFELLGTSGMTPDEPEKWAGPAGLKLVHRYESDTGWLWPWEGLTPFYEEVEVVVGAPEDE